MNRSTAFFLSFGLVLLTPTFASADDLPSLPPPTSAAPPKPQPDVPVVYGEKAPDYRMKMIITDLALTAAFATSGALAFVDEGSRGLTVPATLISFGAFVAAGAGYHATYDNKKMTGLSAANRVLTPLFVGALAMYLPATIEGDSCDGGKRRICNYDAAYTAGFIGMVAGMVAATVIDTIELVPTGRRARPLSSTPTGRAFSVGPSVAAAPSGGQLGVVGTF